MYEKEVIQLPQDFPFLTFATDARQMVMHQHDCLEINRILSGSGTYWIEEKQYEILPGDIFIINNQEQHMAVHDGSLLMQVFLFDPVFIWEGPSGWHFLEPFYHFSNRIREVGLYQDLDRIVKEAKGKEEGWQLMVSSLLLVFLAELRRYHKQYQEAGKDVHTSYQRIRPVLSYMQQHLDEPVSLEQLAAQAALHPHYLCTCFKEALGLTISEYWKQLRIHRACMLLASTDKPVTEIAIECGFNSLSYFHRTFRKVQGTSPRQYRENLKIVP